MTTTNIGKLHPIGVVPVLPGDTMQHNTTALIRCSPLVSPVMHPVSVRIHHFFVPNRIVWPDWEDFITGGSDGTAIPLPKITTTGSKNTMLHHLGLPPIAGVDVLALPVYAVNKIINEFYRDQDLVTERAEDDISEFNVAWEKDYFTTARPWTQKGPEISVPIGGAAPVRGIGAKQGNTINSNVAVWDTADGNTTYQFGVNRDSGDIVLDSNAQPEGRANVWADLSQATGGTVNDFRAAFSLQRYQEARARYGSRFTEYLRYLGINPSDARLQRPEFLGGGTSRLNFSEVLQTAPGEASDTFSVGDMYGHGIAGVRSNRYRKFFEEHGYVVSMMSVRPKSIYMNGIPREFLKDVKEDFYQKELANLGQQEIFQAELYAEDTQDVFGFQDRYQEYRYQPSQVTGDFRDTLNSYHLARELQQNVTLNEDFVKCDPSDRIFQDNSAEYDKLWVMANHHIVARRMVPKRANPRII
ncbi:major capsid protein [Microviridae sp.]|nr:major capsid protein [Microviridae sp.]